MYGGESRCTKMLWDLFSTVPDVERLTQGRGVPPMNLTVNPGPGYLWNWSQIYSRALLDALKAVAANHSMQYVELATKLRVLHYEWFRFYAGPPDEGTKADLALLFETS